MSLQQTGRVCQIGQTVTFQSQNGNSYSRRQLVLDTTRCDMYSGERSKYESFAAFDFDGDNCKQLDNLSVDQIVTVDFQINGRKYTDRQTGETKYFNALRGTKVTPKQAQQPSPTQTERPMQNPQPSPQPWPPTDNLPF